MALTGSRAGDKGIKKSVILFAGLAQAQAGIQKDVVVTARHLDPDRVKPFLPGKQVDNLVKSTGSLSWKKKEAHHIVRREIRLSRFHDRTYGIDPVLVILYAHMGTGMDKMLLKIMVVHGGILFRSCRGHISLSNMVKHNISHMENTIADSVNKWACKSTGLPIYVMIIPVTDYSYFAGKIITDRVSELKTESWNVFEK